MPPKAIVFLILLIALVLYAGRSGGAPERLVTAMMVVAAVATGLLPFNHGTNFDRMFLADFVIDAALFAGLLVIALRANRFWPIWVAGLQLLTIAIHLVKSIDPTILPIVYAWAAYKIAYPMLALVAIGVRRSTDRRRLHGREADWLPARW